MTTDPTITAFGSTQHRVVLPAIGDRIDRFAILAELGAGAMGAVFLAADTQLDRRIAVKVLTRGTQDSRLLDEARALAKLQHPNVVAIHDVGRWNDRVYLAMEYIEGGSLASWLDDHTDWTVRLDAFVQAAHGLAAAHRAGLVHHDVKPSNIMVGNDGRVRLVDFGLARATPDLADGTPAGTPRYMSPEQRRGVLADARTDQFSLCVALYEALFDAHPFAGDTADERAEAVFADRVEIPRGTSVPAHVTAAVVKGLACDPAKRHPTIDALVQALTARPRRRRVVVAIVAATAIAAGVTIAIVTTSRASDEPVIVPVDHRHAIIVASHLPDELHEPLPKDPFGVTIHRLSNGLTVYISPDHTVPRVRAMWRFNGGNADAPGIAAAAGLVASEHGSETIGTINYAAEKPHLDRIRALYRERTGTTGEARARIDRLIDLHSTLASLVEIPDEHERLFAGLGAVGQAQSVYEHEMKFRAELPSNRLGVWADIEADRWTHRVIRNFRARVRRLIKQTDDSGARLENRVIDALLPIWFPGNTHPALTHEVVMGMVPEPIDAIDAYARDHFVPNNADLILAGDVDPTTAIPLLEKAFAGWEPRELPAIAPAAHPTRSAATLDIPSSGQRTIGHYWVLDLAPEDRPAYVVVDKLIQRLRATRFATRPGETNTGSYVPMRDYEILDLPPPGVDLAEGGRTIDMLVDAVRHGEFSDAELEAVKRNVHLGTLLLTTTLEARVDAIAYVDMRGMGWQKRLSIDNQLPAVTRADVQRVADRIFAGAYVTTRVSPAPFHVDRVDPGPEPHEVPPKRRTSSAGEALIARPHAELQPKFLLVGRDYESKQTRGNYVIAARLSGSPLSKLTVRWDVGFQELPGACNALQSRYNGAEINDLMFRYGVEGNWRCEAAEIQLTMLGADDQLARAFELLSASLADPTPDEWAHTQAMIAHVIADHRGDKVWLEEATRAFGRHGFATPVLQLWSAKAMGAVTYADGLRALRGLRATAREIAYVGPRSVDDVAALVPATSPGAAPKPMALPKFVKMPRVLMLDAKGFGTAVQASVQLVLDNTDRRVLLDLLIHYWTPAVWPMRIPGKAGITYWVPQSKRDGHYIIELKIETTAANAAAAVEDAITELTTSHADPANVAVAKSMVDGYQRANWLNLDDLGTKLLLWHANGIEGDPREADFVKRDRLTAADLRSLRRGDASSAAARDGVGRPHRRRSRAVAKTRYAGGAQLRRSDPPHRSARYKGATVTTPLTTPTVTAFGGTQHRVVLPEIGEQIDRYAILAELGSGAMGAVFLAADTQLDRRIAVKVLTRGTQDSRLLDEARALAKLQHPNVVAIHDVGRWNERVYLAMEYIEGGSLASWLETHADWRERLDAFVQAAHGLGAAHRAGLVHHDVKPSNIMVGTDGRVRLVDFGLARTTPELADGTPAGTPRYMSPEQRRGALADARTDQYSLCVALYEALFDDHPFAGASAEERGSAVLEDRVEIPKSTRVPPHVIGAIVKGLAWEPARRHSTIDALIGALSAPPKSRRRIVWIGAAASVAIAAGITAAIVSSAPGDRVIAPVDPKQAILAASNLPDELHEPLPGDPYGVTIHRLSNGLTVFISPDHSVPRVRAMWRFNGGNGDAPGIAAAAGLVATEHGTETTGTINYAAEKPHLDRIRELYRERVAATGDARTRIDHLIDLHSTLASLVEIPDEHERIVDGLGASWQSHTVFPHEMKFTTELPSNRLGVWAEVEADRWTHRVIRNFRARLRRLVAQTEDTAADVSDRAIDALLATWFAGDRREPTTHDVVAGMAAEQLDAVDAYARDHFVPNNADLVLVGDVDPTTAIPLLEKAFATWEPRQLPTLTPALRPEPIAKTVEIASSGQRTITYVWPLDLPFEDNSVFYMIDMMLGRIATSRFASKLGEFRTGSYVRRRDFGLMALPTPAMDSADAERTLDAIVNAVRHGEFSDDELEAVKRNLRFDTNYLATDFNERIEAITKFHMREISWQKRVALIARLPSITRADVLRVADRMFSRPHVTLRVSPGPIHVDRVGVGPEPRAVFPKRRTSPAGEALLARPHAPLQPKFLLAGRDYESKQLRGTYRRRRARFPARCRS